MRLSGIYGAATSMTISVVTHGRSMRLVAIRDLISNASILNAALAGALVLTPASMLQAVELDAFDPAAQLFDTAEPGLIVPKMAAAATSLSPELPAATITDSQISDSSHPGEPTRSWGAAFPAPLIYSTDALGEPWDWQVLPKGLFYQSYAAGEQEPRLSSAFLYRTEGDTYWDSVLGGRVGLLRYGTRDGNPNRHGFQLDFEGGAFLRMQPQEDRDVRSVDFRGGFPVTYRNGPFHAKVGYYHISSHLGDEYQLKNPWYVRNNYSRDCIVMGAGYDLSDSLRIYAETGWAFYTSGGAEPLELQTGVEWASRRPTGLRGAPYAAANLHLWEETNWGGSINLIAGWQWRSDDSERTFRFGLQYYNGQTNQKSFLGQTDELFGFGIRYDF